jgi:hypothetical protein
MSGFTPGPWFVEGATIIWSSAGRATVAAVGEPRATQLVEYRRLSISSPHFNEACANARLIAAAPELLEALIHLSRFVLVQYDGIPGEPGSVVIDSQHNDAALKARAAIAKATGAA